MAERPPQSTLNLSGEAGANSAPVMPKRRSWAEHPWVQEVLPFVTSVAVHLAIVMVGVIFFLGATYSHQPPVHQEQFVIPVSQLQAGALDGISAAGGEADSIRPIFQDRFKDGGTPEGWASEKGSRFNLREGGGSGDSTDAVVGAGPGGAFGSGRTGRGAGIGNDLGSGEGAGGPLAMFGTVHGGAGGAGTIFLPPVGAKRVAFVCDASGSMVSKFSTLRRELSKSVHRLTPVQSFNLIFFKDAAALSMGGGLTIATPDAKLRADQYLESITPRATTNPLPALTLAFSQKPELIYFLTDGDFPDNEAVLAHIRQLNKTAHVTINTIAFVTDTDTETSFIDVLKKIAQETGGTFRYVREGDF